MSTKQASYDEKVLDYIEITGAVLDKSAEAFKKKEASDKACAKLIPLAVQALLENERIEPHEKEAAAQVLQDPTKVLEILIRTAQHRNDNERPSLGTPVKQASTKQAYDSLKNNYVGRKMHPDETESSKALKRGLGLS